MVAVKSKRWSSLIKEIDQDSIVLSKISKWSGSEQLQRGIFLCAIKALKFSSTWKPLSKTSMEIPAALLSDSLYFLIWTFLRLVQVASAVRDAFSAPDSRSSNSSSVLKPFLTNQKILLAVYWVNKEWSIQGEVYHKSQIPEDQMPTKVWVKRSEGGDRTPSPRQISKVQVPTGECDRSEDTVREVPSQVRSPLLEHLPSTLMEEKKLRGPE
ncbi:hypothetical protein B0H14DRAFT_2589910 [Mycena olivaceomarginata]|nr:hypothetical protein B0H14DRAFT_2589910 [Mycena olivaceomarginata]